MAKVTKELSELRSTALDRRVVEVPIVRDIGTTHVAFVLDSSGSMWSIYKPTIEAFNRQLREIRQKAAHEVLAYLVTFGRRVTELLMAEPIHALTDLDENRYQPEGGTPLLDAVGLTTQCMDVKAKDAGLVIVISDGQENASRTWTWDSLGQRIRDLQATGRWTFVFIGPLDVANRLEGIGFKTENILKANPAQLASAFAGSADNLGRFLEARNQGKLLSAYFGGDK